MATITIAGLGPGRRGLRTMETVEAIDSARVIILRTAIHPGIDDLATDARVVVCDDVYEQADSFEEVYDGIAHRVLHYADAGDVLYLVPGHPRYGEHVTLRIEFLAYERGHDVVVLSAVSALDEISASLAVDLMADEPQTLDATTLSAAIENEPFSAGRIDASPFRPLLITQVYSSEMASATKLALSRLYGEEHEVVVLRGAGLANQRIERIPLHRLDRVSVDHLTSVWVEPLDEIAPARSFSGLLRIVARLRAPGGCPWDQKQDAKSLVNSLVEETYEAVEAIEADDAAHVAEELGDVLLLIAMQAQIAEEEGLFQIEDVIESITTKLIRRHPHVFGEQKAESAADVVGIWQEVKATEGKTPKPSHPLDRYPAPMPVVRRLIDMFTVEEPTSTVDADSVGDELFRLTKAALDAGLNPETLLLNASKRAIPE
jgi:tetrapyrrole methylase family protein/MazG family protein